MSLPVPGLHFGVWRSPVRTLAEARPVVERIAALEHVFLDGLMGYEAQIAGVGDNYPGKALKNALVCGLKARSARVVAARRAALVRVATDAGARLRFVNGGGTGSIATTRPEAAVTAITVGSGLYTPALFRNYRAFPFPSAARLAIANLRR